MSKKEQTDWEAVLAFQLKTAGIEFDRQFRAVKGRNFRFDFYCIKTYLTADSDSRVLIVERMPDVLVEVQGGVWMPKGGHNTGSGITRDCEKLSLAAVAGYRVICVTPEQIRKGLALQWIEAALK